MTVFSIIIASLYSIVCLIFGMAAIKLLSPDLKSNKNFPLPGLLASGFLLGQGLLAALWLFIGLAGVFKPITIVPILIIVATCGLIYIRGLLSPIINGIMKTITEIWELGTTWRMIVMLLLMLIIVFGMKSVYMPPSGDAIAFYMVLPKIMAYTGALVPQPNYYDFSQVGLFGEMHYAALISIADTSAAKFLNWFTVIGMGAMLVSICTLSGIGKRGSILAAVMIFTSSAVTEVLVIGKVDIFGGALGLAAFYWALCTDEDDALHPFILAGLFAGFSMVAKFSNIPVIAVGVTLIIAWNIYNRTVKRSYGLREVILYEGKLFFLFSVFLLLAIAPHLIKNGLLFGEPFAPFVFLKSQGTQWVDQVWYSPETTRYILATYPIALVFGYYPMQGGNISHLIFAFMPLALFLKKPPSFNRSKMFQISIVALICLLTWMVVRPAVIAPRYILASLLIWIPLAAKGAENITIRTAGFKVLKFSVLAGALLSLLLVLAFNIKAPAHIITSKNVFSSFGNFISGSSGKCDFATTSISKNVCEPLEFVNTIAREESRVFLAGHNSYYLRADILKCISAQQEVREVRGFDDPHEKWAYIFDNNFEYLVIQKESRNAYSEMLKSEKIPDWLEIKEIYRNDASRVYSIRSKEPGRKPSSNSCL